MSEAYSLEEIIRAELKRLRPESAEGAELRVIDGETAGSRSIKDRLATLYGFLRQGWRMGEVDEDAARRALPERLRRELFREKLTALCLSGGGIRSASFCLGVMQSLAQRKLLTDFDYLSTVSGGGYIGGWLIAWASRKGSDIVKVQDGLAARHAVKELENLRAYSNYLTPRAGLMSADTWVGVATVSRNLVLNWSLFLPLFLMAVATPKLIGAFYELLARYPELQRSHPDYERAAWIMLVCAAIFYGVTTLFISREIIETQEHKAEDVAQASGAPPKKVSDRSDSYGAGNVESAVFIVVFVAASACVGASLLTSMPLTIGPLHILLFGVAGATTWFVAFLAARLLPPRTARARADQQLPEAKEAKFNIAWLAFARLGGGFFFGVFLLIGFAPLGNHVRTHFDDRYPIVLGVLIFIFAHLAGGTVFSALSSRLNRMDDALEWSARGAGWLFAAGFAWALYATLALADYTIVQTYAHDWGEELLVAVGGLSGLGAALFGLSRKTSANNGPGARPNGGVNWSKIAVLAALVFFIVLFLECSRLFDYMVFGESFAGLIKQRRVAGEHLWDFLFAYLVLGVWTLAASFCVNVNKFSLHGFYRNRLIRAYLGASHLKRRPNAFTGFDPGDNIDMAGLHADKPMLVVNTALNLVHGDNLAWQERKASSFTISSLVAGNPAVGYRPSAQYGQNISLGTAIAISGAAVSPNMGYHSSPILTFVMMLFNARLGWWLGNPRREAWEISGPRHAFAAFLMELFGYTTDANRFIYLSDGGHFENLGVYEMLLRRCRTIVAIDAGCDAELKFEDLGNLVRKARIDFGIEIKFAALTPPIDGLDLTRLNLANRPNAIRTTPYCVVGEIVYPEIEERGSFVYIKAAIHGEEPEDVRSYAAAHPEFPHETTGDQFFSESQFESYRRLGLHIGERVLGGDGGAMSHALDLEARARAHSQQ